MGEIKSTLDLVMERTKHLTLTKAEKEAQQIDSLQKRLKGLLQKYLDGILNRDELTVEVENLHASGGLKTNDMLKNEILDRVTLDDDNGPLFVLMNELYGIDVQPFLSLLANYQDAIQKASQQRKKELKKSLALNRSISGSAVIPNLESDSTWLKQHADLHDEFSRMLADRLSELRSI